MTKLEIAKHLIDVNGQCFMPGSYCDKCYFNCLLDDSIIIYNKALKYLRNYKLDKLNDQT